MTIKVKYTANFLVKDDEGFVVFQTTEEEWARAFVEFYNKRAK